jgi:hypothetical protein
VTYRIAFVMALLVTACIPVKRPPAAPPAGANERPFDAMPTAVLIESTQVQGPVYRVRLVAQITRDVIPTDDLALVVSVDDNEIKRYPIVGAFAGRPTKVTQEIELPLGDYEIDYVYQGTRYAGSPFRLAIVPVWGGKKVVQLRAHQGTRISLREQKLWVGRWRASDGPSDAWIIEWVHEGQVAATTSGRDPRALARNADSIIGGAAGAYRSKRTLDNTLWAYGEEYPLPPQVATTPGRWAARLVNGSAAPIAIMFTVLPGGRLDEMSDRRVALANWEPSWSKHLEQRGLNPAEVDRVASKLPVDDPDQPFDELAADEERLEPSVRVSRSAVRALFRSQQLAELWWSYQQANKPLTSAVATQTTQNAVGFPKGGKRATGLGSRRIAKSAKEQRTKLRAMRAQIEQLIRTHGGPWKPDEFPRS